MQSHLLRSSAFVISGLLLAFVFFAAPRTTAAATLNILCDPASNTLHVGDNIPITCYGFTPNVTVFAYTVEPSGTADALGPIKADAQGTVSFTIATDFGTEKEKTGAWKVVVEETGLAHSVLRRGIVEYFIHGATVGVSGATLSANPSQLNKPAQAYGFFTFNDTSGGNTIHLRETYLKDVSTVISGSGFTPGEMVSFWVDPPNGGCSNFTIRSDANEHVDFPPIAKISGNVVQNDPGFGLGSHWIGDAKADQSGNASTGLFFDLLDCEGVYHVVGRGNISGAGGDTFVTLVGNAVTTSASLEASPGVVHALFDHIQFSGSGFAAGEHVTCWSSSPQGITWALPGISEFNGTETGPGISVVEKDTQIFADNSGSFSFGIVTGSFYRKFDGTFVEFGVNVSNKTIQDPFQSEGGLGTYAATCRGDTSGRNAITHFTVTGNELTP